MTTIIPRPDAHRRVTVVVADDNALFRTGLRQLLAPHGIDVLGEADNGLAAVAEAERLRPDAILMDLDMPGSDGLSATPHAPVPVVVLTGSSGPDEVVAALAAGATGYVLKDAGAAHIAEAVRAALRGEAVFGPQVAERLAAHVRTQRPSDRPTTEVELTDRETEVLRRVADGADNATIAADLGIGAGTVKDHVGSILAKLGVANRVQAAVWAARHGLVDDG